MTWKRITIKDRLERNSIPEPNTGCWLWTSCVDHGGYGYLHNRQGRPKNLKAHRLAYEQFIGPIPEGAYVCHSCDVPSCINPRHLWLGTHEENQKDRIRKGRSAKGSDFKRSRLNEELVKAIRMAVGSMRIIGLQFGLSPQTVHEVRTRKIWKHVS